MVSTIRTTQSSSDNSLPNIGSPSKAKTSEILPLIDAHIGNINDTLGKSIVSGFLSWGDSGNYYSITNGNQFNLLRSGSGKIKNKSVSWLAGQFVLLTPNKTAHIYINENGIIGKVDNDSMSESIYQNNIVLFQALYDGTNFIITKANHSYEFPVQVAGYIRKNIGAIVEGIGANIAKITSGTGGVVTDRQIKVVGADNLINAGLLTAIPDSGALAISIHYMFKNSSGKWGRYAYQDTVPMVYNNAGVVTVLPNGSVNSVSVMSLYVAKDDLNTSNPKYIGCVHNGTFNTVSDAIDAIQGGLVVVSDNELSFLDLCSLGYVVIKNNTSNGYIDSAIISKDTINARKVGGGAGNSHLTLADLNKGQFGDGGHDNLPVMKVTASTDPTVNDDGQYFKEGSFWLNKETGITYVLVNGTIGAADWRVSGGSGSGSPSIFAILQADYDKLTWTQGNNATFLGSGTATATFVKNATDVVLSGKYSYKWTLGSVNDWLCSGDISVPKRHQGRTIKVDFPFLYNGMSSDIKLQFWDATNSAPIPLETTYIQATNGVSGTTSATINIPSTCLNMRVGFHNLSANSGKILYFDDVVFDGDALGLVNSFSVGTRSGLYTSTIGGKLNFNTSVLDKNFLNNFATYDSATALFTAKKGFSLNINVTCHSTNDSNIALFVNSVLVAQSQASGPIASAYYRFNLNQDIYIDQYATFYIAAPSGTIDGSNTKFSLEAKSIDRAIQSSYSPNDLIGEVVRLPRNVCPSGCIPAMGTVVGLSSGNYQGGAYYDLYKVLWEMSGIACASSSVYTNVNITTNRFSPDQASHSFVTGTPVQITTTGSLPGGLSLATTYYVYVISSTSYCLATTFDNAINGIVIDITSQGTGTHTITIQTGFNPYILNGVKGSDALTDWNAGKTIYINESGFFERVYQAGKSGEVGAWQLDAFQGHEHNAYRYINATGGELAYAANDDDGTRQILATSGIVTNGANGAPRTASETRPINVAKYAFIRYGNAQPTVLLLPNAAQTEYVLEVNSNASQTVAHTTAIPFSNIVTNKNMNWNGTSLVVPLAGIYKVSATILTSNTGEWGLAIYVNGSNRKTFPYSPKASASQSLSGEVYLQAGDIVDIRQNSTATVMNLAPSTTAHWLSITRLNGKNDSVCVGNVSKNQVAIVKDVKASGTSGGSSIATTWIARTLNTVDGDSQIVSLDIGTSRITLQAGEYEIDATSPFLKSYSARIRLRNISDGSTSILGESSFDASDYNVGISTPLKGRLSLSSAKTFELQYFVGVAYAIYGLGVATSSGENEVYTQIKITKLNGN